MSLKWWILSMPMSTSRKPRLTWGISVVSEAFSKKHDCIAVPIISFRNENIFKILFNYELINIVGLKIKCSTSGTGEPLCRRLVGERTVRANCRRTFPGGGVGQLVVGGSEDPWGRGRRQVSLPIPMSNVPPPGWYRTTLIPQTKPLIARGTVYWFPQRFEICIAFLVYNSLKNNGTDWLQFFRCFK